MRNIRLRFRVTLPAGSARNVLIFALSWLCVLYPPRAASATLSPQGRIPLEQRQYYITQTLYEPILAKLACAEGYHFASMWELMDTSNLQYNTDLGVTSPDSGSGPPVAQPFFSGVLRIQGWVRTGYVSYTGNTPGRSNCANWISISDTQWGTVIRLPDNWVTDQKHLGQWEVITKTCDNTLTRVWCVEDSVVMHDVFLPVVMK